MPEHKYRHLFSADEWFHFLHLGNAIHDPKEKRDFYADIMERKTADPKFSVFDRYPVRSAALKAGIHICGETIEMLKESNARREQVQKFYVQSRNKDLDEWGKAFGEHIDAELKRKAEEGKSA